MRRVRGVRAVRGMRGVGSAAAVQLRRVVPLGGGRTHGDGNADLARLSRQYLGLALAGRRVALLGAAARALGGRVLALAPPALAAMLLAALEALYEPWVQDILLRLPSVVLRFPPFPFHVVLDLVLKTENSSVIKLYYISQSTSGGVRPLADVARLPVACDRRRVAHSLADFIP